MLWSKQDSPSPSNQTFFCDSEVLVAVSSYLIPLSSLLPAGGEVPGMRSLLHGLLSRCQTAVPSTSPHSAQ